VARRLKHVRPVSEKRIGTRIEKKWLLKDASPALQSQKGPQQDGVRDQELTPEMQEDLKMLRDFTFECLLPAVVDADTFRGILTGYLRDELKLSKRDCAKVYRIAAGGLCWTLSDFFKRQRAQVPKGSTVDALNGKSDAELDAWIAEYWPDKPAPVEPLGT
jgi:hypothetical protein